MSEIATVIRAPALGPEALSARVAAAELDGAVERALPRASPRVAVMPFARQPAAVVIAAAPAPPIEGATVHAYRVTRTEPIPGPAEGPGMITLLHRKPGLDRDDFLARWHEGHTPLAIHVHPLVRYVRWVIEEALDGAPPLDGIVLERVAERADLVRPWRFFGGPLAMLVNAPRIGLDAARFLDLGAVENHLVEHRLG